MALFSGLSAFPVTPLSDGAVATDRFQTLIERLVRPGVASIGALGSTGLYPYLDLAERSRAYRAAVDAAGETPVLAGIGAFTADDAIRSAEAAAAAGCAGLLLAPVQYLPLTDDEVMGLFAEVARATSLPVLVYNNPGTTGRDIDEALLIRLAEIDGVDGVKNPSAVPAGVAAQLDRLRGAVPEGFSLGYSGDATIAAALDAGAGAWYSVIAGTLPELAVALWSAQPGAARAALDERLEPLWTLFRAHGGIRIVYGAAEVMGLGTLSLPRPLAPLTRDAMAELEAALDPLSAEAVVG